MDNLDFLDAPAGAPEPMPVEAEAPAVEQAEGPARGPDGKFASREAQPEPVIEPEPLLEAPVAQEPQAPQPAMVPLSALQELRREIRQLKQAPPQQAPDRYEDPEGYEAHREQQVEQRLLNQTLNFSERFARKEHGAETVDKARDWALEKFQSDPLYYQRVMSDADPYEAVVQDWKREQVLSSMKDGDLDAFLAWKTGAAGQAPAAPAPIVAPPRNPSPPPRSLAAAPNAGGAKPGAQPVGPGVAFDTTFKD